MQSAHPFSFWGVINRTVESSRIVAQSMECPIQNSKEMMNCIRSKDPVWVVARQVKVFVRFQWL